MASADHVPTRKKLPIPCNNATRIAYTQGGDIETMEWGLNARRLTRQQRQELEFRLEAVALAAEVGVSEAVRVITQLQPNRQVRPATIRAWVRGYESAHALDLSSLKLADQGRN